MDYEKPDGPSISRDVKSLNDAFLQFMARMDERVSMIVSTVERMERRFDESERANAQHRALITDNAHEIKALRIDVDEVIREHCKVAVKVEEMRPWVIGMEWAMKIAGGILVVMFVGGIIWAVVQSGAAVP